MPRYEFSIGSSDVRRKGAVDSDTFKDALDVIAVQADAETGDLLEIGVRGFPPAKFQYVFSLDEGTQVWRAAYQRAA
jgi:hypothetical protein